MKLATVRRVDPQWLNAEIGKRLTALRKARELTQLQVSEGLGVSRACVANWERGKHQQNHVLTTLYNLALFYRVPVRRLLP